MNEEKGRGGRGGGGGSSGAAADPDDGTSHQPKRPFHRPCRASRRPRAQTVKFARNWSTARRTMKATSTAAMANTIHFRIGRNHAIGCCRNCGSRCGGENDSLDRLEPGPLPSFSRPEDCLPAPLPEDPPPW